MPLPRDAEVTSVSTHSAPFSKLTRAHGGPIYFAASRLFSRDLESADRWGGGGFSNWSWGRVPCLMFLTTLRRLGRRSGHRQASEASFVPEGGGAAVRTLSLSLSLSLPIYLLLSLRVSPPSRSRRTKHSHPFYCGRHAPFPSTNRLNRAFGDTGNLARATTPPSASAEAASRCRAVRQHLSSPHLLLRAPRPVRASGPYIWSARPRPCQAVIPMPI